MNYTTYFLISMQTFTSGYLKIVTSKNYDKEIFSSLVKPFSDLPITIFECYVYLDGIQFDVCVPGFDLSKFMVAMNTHKDEVIKMFNEALVYRALSNSPVKDELINEITSMIKDTKEIDINELGCDKVSHSVSIKTDVIAGSPFIRYHTKNLTIVVPASIGVNLSCFVDEVSQKLGNNFLRFVIDPFPSIYFNSYPVMSVKHDVKDTKFYLKVLTFIKYLSTNNDLLNKVSSVAKEVKEIEDREIYYEFKLKALIDETEQKLKEFYRSVNNSK